MKRIRIYFKLIVFPACVALLAAILGAAIALRYIPYGRPSTQEISLPLSTVPSSVSLSFSDMKALTDNLVFFVNPEAGADYISISDSFGVGFALTSDGLVATGASLPVSAHKAATSDRTINDTQRVSDARGNAVVIPDTGLTLVKVLDASLKVVPFASYEDLKVGDTLVSFDQKGAPDLHRLVALWNHAPDADGTENSEDITNFLRLDGERAQKGSPAYTMEGELAGVFDVKGRVIPGQVIQDKLARYIEHRNFKKTFLGVRFLDLNPLIPVLAKSSGGGVAQKEGLLLKDGRTRVAVTKGSPASVAGLKAGDVLLELEGQRLNDSIPFQMLLQRYRPGTEVEFLVLRHGGNEEKIKVVLGEQ